MTHHKQIINSVKVQRDIFFLWALCVTVIGLKLIFFPQVTISPLVETVCAQDTETKSDLRNRVDYLLKSFEIFGEDKAIKALKCSIGESGLNPKAYGWNPPYTDKNGIYHEATEDYGMMQLNNKWQKVTKEQGYDWKFSIDRAVKVYEGRNNTFGAWYAPTCR